MHFGGLGKLSKGVKYSVGKNVFNVGASVRVFVPSNMQVL